MVESFEALELWPENTEAWRAWAALSSSRPAGFGPGAIPLTEIEAWFRMTARTVERLLVEKIQRIDSAFLAVESAKQEAKSREAKRPTRSHTPQKPRRR